MTTLDAFTNAGDLVILACDTTALGLELFRFESLDPTGQYNMCAHTHMNELTQLPTSDGGPQTNISLVMSL